MAPQTEEEPDDGSGEGRPAHFGRRRESPCAAPTGAHSATTSPCREGPRALPLAPPIGPPLARCPGDTALANHASAPRPRPLPSDYVSHEPQHVSTGAASEQVHFLGVLARLRGDPFLRAASAAPRASVGSRPVPAAALPLHPPRRTHQLQRWTGPPGLAHAHIRPVPIGRGVRWGGA